MAINEEGFGIEIEVARLSTNNIANQIQNQLNNIKDLSIKVGVDTAGIKQSIQNAINAAGKDISKVGAGISSGANAGAASLNATVKQIERIQSAMNNGTYSAKISELQAGFKRIGLSAQDAAKKVEGVKAAYAGMKGLSGEALVAAQKNFNNELVTSNNELRVMRTESAGVVTTLQQVKLTNRIQTWLKNNTAATKEAKREMQTYLLAAQGGTPLSTAEYNKINGAIDTWTTKMRMMGKLGNSWGNSLKAGISKFSSWFSASMLFMRGVNWIRKGIQTITDLDSALTNINYTMDVSSSQLKEIGNSSIQMAKDLKTSTSNVLQAVTLYANANETADSILQKAQTAAMLSNVSGVSGSAAADMLQGISNQFDIEPTVEGLNHISDVVQNVSQNLAYDFTKGISAINEAISNSGSVAHMAGLDLEEYAAMVGKTIEVTRQGGSTVGNAYKTIFTRITKASKTEGTSEEDISAAEKSLRSVNIEVRKNAEEFRDVTDILSDLGQVWDTLSSVEQSKISFDLAGTRQTNILKSLLSNWQDYTDIVDKAYDAQGTTLENQEKYAESYKGRMQELKSVSESFWNNILNSGTLKTGIGFVSTLLKLLDKLTGTLGGLGTIGLGAGIFAGVKNLGRDKMGSLRGIIAA